MQAADGIVVGEVAPAEAYAILQRDPDTALVDVRTHAEWSFVGVPDLEGVARPLLNVEWVRFPSMTTNTDFLADLKAAAGGELPGHLLFICRSGSRSLAAARAVAGAAGRRCTNVAEGFEGDLDGEGHRGRLNGWKVAGLPWRQG